MGSDWVKTRCLIKAVQEQEHKKIYDVTFPGQKDPSTVHLYVMKT